MSRGNLSLFTSLAALVSFCSVRRGSDSDLQIQYFVFEEQTCEFRLAVSGFLWSPALACGRLLPSHVILLALWR